MPCSHCGTPVQNISADDKGPWFCCHGCRTVYGLLHECRLDNYYHLREATGIVRPESRLPALVDTTTDSLFADSDYLQQQVVIRTDGLHECRLFIEGIHCAACVWLLERIRDIDRGIRSSRLHFARNALDVVYDPDLTTVAQIAGAVRRLGYRPYPWNDRDTDRRLLNERRRWALRCAIAAGSAVATMHLSVNLFAGDITGDLDPAARSLFGWLSCLASIPAVTWCAMPFHRAAAAALGERRFTLDLIVSIVIILGFGISTVHLMIGRSDLYFDAIAMFCAFLLAGRLVALAARDGVSGDASALLALLPRHARRLIDDQPTVIPIASLGVGDRVLLQPGDTIPGDGPLVTGAGTVDSAVLTGESIPTAVASGDVIYGGSKWLEGDGIMQVAMVREETRFGRLVTAVRNAQPGPSAIAAVVDRMLWWFAPVVAVAALATAGVWWTLDPSRIWDQVVALILVACPCALGLAAPLVQAVAVMRAARAGILLRDPAALERLAECRHAVLDKTGTLTSGRMQVSAWQWHHNGTAVNDDWWLPAIAGLAQRSGHPAAQAVARHLHATTGVAPDDWSEVPGHGISGHFGRHSLSIGRPGFAGAHNETAVQHPGSVVHIAVDGQCRATIQLEDPLRPEAQQLVQFLVSAGYTVHLASGDHAAAVTPCAQAVGIAQQRVHSACDPQAKADLVRSLAEDGGVLMLGDGINDAPALCQATVGIGLRGGLEAALQVASVFVVRPDLTLVEEVLRGAAATRVNLRRCLWFSLLYNGLGMAAAMIGWWGPWVCAIAMPLSSLSVIALAMAGRSFRLSPAAAPARLAPAPG